MTVLTLSYVETNLAQMPGLKRRDRAMIQSPSVLEIVGSSSEELLSVVSELAAWRVGSNRIGVVRSDPALGVEGPELFRDKSQKLTVYEDRDDLGTQLEQGWNAGLQLMQLFPGLPRLEGHIDIQLLLRSCSFFISCGGDGEGAYAVPVGMGLAQLDEVVEEAAAATNVRLQREPTALSIAQAELRDSRERRRRWW